MWRVAVAATWSWPAINARSSTQKVVGHLKAGLSRMVRRILLSFFSPYRSNAMISSENVSLSALVAYFG